jgi:hypothetical protein
MMMKKLCILILLLLSVLIADNDLRLKYGFINKKGNFVINPVFISASDFSEGLAFVSKYDQKMIIDKEGNVISTLPKGIINVKPYSEGLAIAVFYEDNKEKSVFIDGHGRTAIDNNYICATSFSEGVSVGFSKRGYELVGKNGIVLSKIEPTEIEGLCADSFYDCKITEGMLPVLKKREWKTNEEGNLYAIEHWGYIGKNGNWVIDAKYNKAVSFSEGLGLVNIGMISTRGLEEWTEGKWGFVDKKGKFNIKTRFVYALSFKEGVAAICEKNIWGFIDKQGKYVIKPKFEKVMSFSEGLAAVKLRGKWGFINKNEKVVINQIFESDSIEYMGYVFSDGLAPVKYKGKWGYIDKNGNWIITPIYDEAYAFIDGLAKVRVCRQ